jgi:hypothetical protein
MAADVGVRAERPPGDSPDDGAGERDPVDFDLAAEVDDDEAPSVDRASFVGGQSDAPTHATRFCFSTLCAL